MRPRASAPTSPVAPAAPTRPAPKADAEPKVAAVSPFYAADTLRPQHSVGWLMRQAMKSILLQVDRALAQHDLTHAQWMPLFRIAQGQACTVAALAREQSKDPGAMTRSLDRLEAKGLVQRVRSETDRRVVHLVLTEAGRAAAARVPPVLAEVLNQHLAGFSPDEWQLLLGLLQRMVANGELLRENREA